MATAAEFSCRSGTPRPASPAERYGAGRYLLDTIKGAFHGVQGSGPGAEFVLDFNFAYNPSCAYNEAWACPLPGPVEPPGRGDPGGRAVLSRRTR